jgi:hypothetical protein
MALIEGDTMTAHMLDELARKTPKERFASIIDNPANTPDKYDLWKDIVLKFDPRHVLVAMF